MATDEPPEGILSVRMLRPGKGDELEIIFESQKGSKVDGVYTRKDAVERILLPFYEREARTEEYNELKSAIDAVSGEFIVVLHKKSCSFFVAPIDDWDAPSPIRV